MYLDNTLIKYLDNTWHLCNVFILVTKHLTYQTCDLVYSNNLCI